MRVRHILKNRWLRGLVLGTVYWVLCTRLPATGPVAAPAAPAAKAATGTLLPGTRFATPYYIQDSGRPGPTVLVTGGIHGNEPAGAAAADEIRAWKIASGRLIVIPRLNVPGLAAKQRRIPQVDASLADLNRDFPRAGKDEPPRGTPAVEIWEFVKQQKPAWLIDLHEASSVRGSQPGAVGNTLLPCGPADVQKTLATVAKAANAKIADPKYKFVLARLPKDGSLARTAGEHLGAQAFIIETTGPGQTLATRVGQHESVVRALLVELGMVVEEQPKRR